MNPFITLGLNQNLIAELTDEQIFQVVESQRKALQRLYHPDKGNTDSEKSRLVNEAADSLTSRNSELYRKYKQDFLARKVIKKDYLVSSLLEESKKVGPRYDQLISYLQCATGLIESINVFSMHNFTLKMLEVVNTITSSDKKDHFYTLKIRDREIIRLDKKGETKLKNKGLIGVIEASKEPQESKLSKIIDLATPGYTKKEVRKGYILSSENRGEIRSGLHRISPANFQPIMDLLSPEVKENVYLFSINLDEEEIYFSLEGKILRFEKK